MTTELLDGARDLLVSSDQPRPWPRAFALLVPVACAALSFVGTAWLRSAPVIGADLHSHLSLNMAVARAFCGAPWTYSPDHDLAQTLYTTQSSRDVPLRQVAASTEGTLERYCATLQPYRNQFQPFVTNEASLMLLESAAFRIDRDLSLAALGRWLQAVRLALLAFFALSMLRSGASVALVTIVAAFALDVLRVLQVTFHFAVYPLILPLVLALVGLYALSRPWIAQSVRRAAVAATVLGLAAASLVNLRTEYFPFVCALHLSFVLAVTWRQEHESPSRARLAATLGVPFVIAGVLFQVVLVRTPRDGGANYAYHSVSHPLVLSLALPANGFAETHGIKWSDAVGPELARQIDPAANFVGTSYEAALFGYYGALWRQYPGEMLEVYRAKARVAGPDAIAQLRASPVWSPLVRGLLSPFAWLSNGIQFLALLIVSSVASFWLHVSRRWLIGLPMAMLFLVAALAETESLVVMPFFYPQHHGMLLLALASIPIVVGQRAIDAIAVRALARGGLGFSGRTLERRSVPLPPVA